MFGAPGSTPILDWYLDSVAGNDDALGTSADHPRKTLVSISGILAAGATVHCKRGSRFHETFSTTKAINFAAYGASGNKPCFDGSLILDNAEFAAVDGYANVYAITVSYLVLDHDVIIGSKAYHSAIQFFVGPPVPYVHGVANNDNRLRLINAKFTATFAWQNTVRTHEESLAYVQANPGTFYVATTGGVPVEFPVPANSDEFTLYVHLPDSANPRTSGDEYSIGSLKDWVWYQRQGGALDNIWWARWSYQNHGYFEGVTMTDCEWSQAARHGPFHNNSRVARCKSSGLYLAGAAFHGYRDTAGEGTGLGNTYENCEAYNGEWAAFSHGSGGPRVADHNHWIGGTIANLEATISWDTVDTSTVTGLTATDVTCAIGGSSPIDWSDCAFSIKRSADANPPSSTNIGVFDTVSDMNLTRCTIDGGDATGDGGAPRYLCNHVGTGIVLTDSAVTTRATTSYDSQPVTLVNTVWPGT